MSENTLRDSRRKKFFTVDNDTIDAYGAQIGVYGFSVYSLLLRYAGSSDTAFPSYKTIGEKFGFSERQAIRTVGLLVEVGLIKKTTRKAQNGGATSNLYTLVDLPPYDTQSPPPMTHSHPPYDCVSYEEEPIKKTQLKKTNSARDVDSKTNQPSRAREKKSKSGLVGFDEQKPIPVLENLPDPEPTATDPLLLSADNAHLPMGHNPDPIQAAPPPPSSAVPPSLAPQTTAPTPGSSPATVALVTRLLLDPAVIATSREPLRHKAAVRAWIMHRDADWLLHHFAVWWHDIERGEADGFELLAHRINHDCMPNRWPQEFTDSELYARHYPLDPERAAEWAQWQRYANLPAHVREDSGIYPPAWLDDLAPDVRELLEELPQPTAQATGEAVTP